MMNVYVDCPGALASAGLSTDSLTRSFGPALELIGGGNWRRYHVPLSGRNQVHLSGRITRSSICDLPHR